MSLQLIKTDCVELSGRLKALAARARAAGDTELSRTIEEALADAAALLQEARQPARVGLVGAFNAGKTRLLEALLGCAGRLNVIDKPATGNLVEFELEVGEVEQTRLDGWKVLFMAEVPHAGRILRRLLGEARDLQNRESALNPAAAELNRLLFEAEFQEGERPRWVKAQEWARLAHDKARANQFKAVAFEVYRLAYTVGQAGGWLGREVPIGEEAALALMSLDYDPQEVYSRDLSDWRLRVPDPPEGGAIGALAPAALKALFPIVRKIVVRATLPPLIAEPFGAGGPDVRMVDCPGAGADGTNLRDGVICAQELHNVDTIFVLLNAKNPGENRQFIDELLRIWGQEAKERILAVVSRFDELPHDKNVSLGRRDALAVGEGPLAAEEVLKAIPTLATIYKAAAHTVIDRDAGRICFASTMGYLSERLQEERRGLRGAAVEFYKQEMGFPPDRTDPGRPAWDQTQQPWVREMAGWAGVAARLARDAGKESQALAGLLDDFAGDGGFGRLHRMFQAHLGRYGQANKLARLMPQSERLKQRVEELEARVREVDTAVREEDESTESDLSAADAVHSLYRAYESYILHAEAETRRYALVRRPPGAAASKAESILPPLRRGLTADIFRWDEWRLLLGRAGRTRSGLVELVDHDDPALKDREADLNDERRTPVKSDDFLPPFLRSLGRLQGVLRVRCLEVLKYHSEELGRELEARLGGPAGVGRLRAAFSGDGALKVDPFSGVAEAVGPGWIDAYLPDAAPDGQARNQHVHTEYFPLQHGAGKPLYYAWHKPLYQAYGRNFDDRHRHMMYVVRLRQVIIDAALAWLDDVSYEVEQAMRSAILGRLKKVRNDLKVEAERHPLQAVAGDFYAD